MFRIGNVIVDGSAGPARADPAAARRVSGCRDHARAVSARRWSVVSEGLTRRTLYFVQEGSELFQSKGERSRTFTSVLVMFA